MRDVYVAWEVPLPPHEVKHQPEPGSGWPTKRRVGLVLQFMHANEPAAGGRTLTETKVVVLDEERTLLEVLPLTKVRVLHPDTLTQLQSQGQCGGR